MLGEIEPISGTRRALPHKGLRVLLQPARNMRASRAARAIPKVREGMEILLFDESPRLRLLSGSAYTPESRRETHGSAVSALASIPGAHRKLDVAFPVEFHGFF